MIKPLSDLNLNTRQTHDTLQTHTHTYIHTCMASHFSVKEYGKLVDVEENVTEHMVYLTRMGKIQMAKFSTSSYS